MALNVSLDIETPTTPAELRTFVDLLDAELEPDYPVEGYAYVDEDTDELVSGLIATRPYQITDPPEDDDLF